MTYKQDKMSIFNSLFSSSSKGSNTIQSKINWIALTSFDQLNEISSLSNENPVLIFKHSTRCSVSRMALKQFETEMLQGKMSTPDSVLAYFLDLIEYRDISNEIANRFQVVHQSPQLLLIKKGQSVYDASHSDIGLNEWAKMV
jgi:bacillithiol system protein YtxJ